MLKGIHFLLTYTCNMECEHCFVYSSPNAKGTFTLDQIRKVLNEAAKIGTIEIGKCADLIILKNNPLNDLTAFRTIQWTIKGGVAKTPKEWMEQ